MIYINLLTEVKATANFSNKCLSGGVKPSETLLFSCEVCTAVLRVVLPTGDQEIISVGDTAADLTLPTGFIAISLNITEIDDSTRNFQLMPSIG